MLVKTKHIHAYTIYDVSGAVSTFVPLDEAINKFLEEENITYDRLIDIKYTPVGYFQPNGGDGELEATALVIYKEKNNPKKLNLSVKKD